MRYIAIIPARGGSKGIPGKNIKPLCGVPLIAYSIKPALTALQEKIIDRVLVSTDSEEIAEIARSYGAEVPFLRPGELSGDTAKSVDAIRHALDWCESHGDFYDVAITLQPTSPLRNVEDIRTARALFDTARSDSLISVYENKKANGFNYYYEKDGIGVPFRKEHNRGVRRQDMPLMYVRNGALYFSTEALIRKGLIIGESPLLYEMPTARSMDIDSTDDFDYLQWKMQQKERGHLL